MPDSDNIPDIDQKRNPLTSIHKKMPAKDQNSPTWPDYETEQYLIADPNFRTDVYQYQDPQFYTELGKLQEKNNLSKNYLKETKVSYIFKNNRENL